MHMSPCMVANLNFILGKIIINKKIFKNMGCGCGGGNNSRKVTPIKKEITTNSENATRIASPIRRGAQPAGRRIIKRRAY